MMLADFYRLDRTKVIGVLGASMKITQGRPPTGRAAGNVRPSGSRYHPSAGFFGRQGSAAKSGGKTPMGHHRAAEEVIFEVGERGGCESDPTVNLA